MDSSTNKICKLFGIKYPIIQAGMVWVSGYKLAAAVSNKGGLGLIGAGSMYPDVLRSHIKKCKLATKNPFGVNIPLFYPDLEVQKECCHFRLYRQSYLQMNVRDWLSALLFAAAFPSFFEVSFFHKTNCKCITNCHC